MKSLKCIAVVAEDFTLGSPAQQLLDRYLLGYPTDGQFHRPVDCEIRLCCQGGDRALIDQRVSNHRLVNRAELEGVLAGAGGVIVVANDPRGRVNDRLIEGVLAQAHPGTPAFVYGALGSSLAAATRHAQLAQSRPLPCVAGTPLAVTWHLPEVSIPADTPLAEALIVVQGPAPSAELEALEALLPWLEKRQGGETGIRTVRQLSGEEVWKNGDAGAWSWNLLAAALSRSDSPQGDALKDGRTQDLIGLRLVPKMALDPRGWLWEHRDGLHSTVLVLDGVVRDYNLAMRTAAGACISAQIYRAPKPAQHEFSRLAAVLEEFFGSGQTPWGLDRALLTAELLERFESLSKASGQGG